LSHHFESVRKMKPHETVPWTHFDDMSDEARTAGAQQFYEHMKTRRSCRFICDGPLPQGAIKAAIMAAGTAPSGANHQPWHFALITSAEAKRAIRIAAEQEERTFYEGKAGEEWLEALTPLGTDADKAFLEDAPLIIGVFGQRRGGLTGEDKKQNYYVVESVGIACGLLLAALHAAGFATLTHTPNPMKFLNQICNRPSSEKPLMLIVVGHASADATVPVHGMIKKSFEEISSFI
jgi:iodotyrosine deiodinase